MLDFSGGRNLEADGARLRQWSLAEAEEGKRQGSQRRCDCECGPRPAAQAGRWKPGCRFGSLCYQVQGGAQVPRCLPAILRVFLQAALEDPV